MWGEEDVLQHACVPLFHGSLPWRLVLRGEQEILDKPQPRRSGPAQLWPSEL